MNTGFSREWEERYRDNTHMSIWPWSDLVSMVMRHARPDRPDFKVLEVGCGAGANIPFFLSLGVQFFAIEGSPSIVKQLHKKYPILEQRIRTADFTQEIPFEETFDLVIDRGSITHNTTPAIHRCLSLIDSKLRQSGKFIGIDWFSTDFSEYHKGHPTGDPYTRTGFETGHFAHVGNVHFSDEQHLRGLFAGYNLVALEHKKTERLIPNDHLQLAAWNFVGVKR